MDKAPFDLQAIAQKFATDGRYIDGAPYGNGHINDTFCIETETGRRYILQRLNGYVFKQPEKLMENVERVTRHVRGKLEDQGRDADRHGLTLVPTTDGRMWHTDETGATWRLYLFIEDSRAYEIVDSAKVAYQGGRAFGEFQKLLADLRGDPLEETIPDFHNMEIRYNTFRSTLDEDAVSRRGQSEREIAFAMEREEAMTLLQRYGRDGRIFNRITHNDTKINNVLFDSTTLEAACVIDLDTVMPGYVHFDFGDSIRTATNTAAEDERNLEKVAIDIELFEAYSGGYLSQAASFLTRNEVDLLAESARIMTFIIGLRFLTDFLDGDRYFRTHFPDHNLIRAKAQFKLVSSMEEHASELRDIVERLYEGVEGDG